MRVARLIEIAAWIFGVAMLGGYAAARVAWENARVAGIEAFQAARDHGTPDPVTPAVTVAAAAEIDRSLWSEERIEAFAASAPAPGAPEALLRIPALQLAVPVYSGTSEINLNRGAAHIEGTAALTGGGNIGIASHRDGFFRKLKDIGIDDELELDVAGRTFTYRVVDLAVVSPYATGVLASTDIPSVTLVTCYPFYFVGHAPQRYIVRAELRSAVATVNPYASIGEKNHER